MDPGPLAEAGASSAPSLSRQRASELGKPLRSDLHQLPSLLPLGWGEEQPQLALQGQHLKLKTCKCQLDLEQSPRRGFVQKPFQTDFPPPPPLPDLLVERITHPANIRAAEEHECFVPSPNSKSVFLKQPLVPCAQELPVGTGTCGSHPGMVPSADPLSTAPCLLQERQGD